MAHETATRTKKQQVPPTPDFLGGMLDTALKAQKQWFGFCTQPFGFAPAPEKMWKHWQTIHSEYLDQTEKTFIRMKDLVTDEVKFVREFSDKTLEMTKDFDTNEIPTVKPEFTREWFDTSRRCIERSVEFNTQSMKAAEEFGMKISEMMMKEPIPQGS